MYDARWEVKLGCFLPGALPLYCAFAKFASSFTRRSTLAFVSLLHGSGAHRVPPYAPSRSRWPRASFASSSSSSPSRATSPSSSPELNTATGDVPTTLLSLATLLLSRDVVFKTTGRGPYHLTYLLEPGDVVIYQVGKWNVEGYAVGDEEKPRLAVVRCEVVQINWTHNMEHSRLLCTPITSKTSEGDIAVVVDEDRFAQMEVGPEQVRAQIGVTSE